MLGVRTKYRRSDWYDAMRFDPTRDNVLSMRDDDKHNELRAKMAHGVSWSFIVASTAKTDNCPVLGQGGARTGTENRRHGHSTDRPHQAQIPVHSHRVPSNGLWTEGAVFHPGCHLSRCL